jgi:hypothetical protein
MKKADSSRAHFAVIVGEDEGDATRRVGVKPLREQVPLN